jgi:hypothetical protein
VAAEAWCNYLLRDKSVIVDLFQGQLRSTLTCGECSGKKVKFDSFMYLSLPIQDPTLAKKKEVEGAMKKEKDAKLKLKTQARRVMLALKLKGGLPPGWTKHMHKTYNRAYFHHKETKRTQWEEPTLEQYKKDQKELGIDVGDDDEEEEEDGGNKKNKADKKADAKKQAAEAAALLKDCDVYNCLEWFSEAETLSGDNQVYCATCAEHRDMTKRVEIWKLPQILICHFKRFGTNEAGERCKDKKTVNFPREGLDLKVGDQNGVSVMACRCIVACCCKAAANITFHVRRMLILALPPPRPPCLKLTHAHPPLLSPPARITFRERSDGPSCVRPLRGYQPYRKTGLGPLHRILSPWTDWRVGRVRRSRVHRSAGMCV